MKRATFAAAARASVLVGARRPRLTLAATLVFTVLSLLAVNRLHADASVGSMFGNRHPAARALTRILDGFGPGEDLLVLASFAPGIGPAAPADRAALLRAYAGRLSDRLAPGPGQDPAAAGFVRSVVFAPSAQMVEYITNELVPAGACFLSDDDLDSLRHRLTRPEMDAQLAQDETMLAAPGPGAGALAKALLRDPLRLREFIGPRLAPLTASMKGYAGSSEFISQDARAILIHIAGTGPPSDLEFARQFTSVVDRVSRACEPGELTVELTGSYAIAALSERSVRHDMVSSIAWSVALMGVLFLLMYRSPFAFPLAMLPVGVGILGAFAFHSLFSSVLTPLTAVIGAMLAGLGSDYGVHLMSHVEHDRTAGTGARLAIDRSLIDLAAPLSMACITSIAGFIALLTSEIPALRDFAALGCLGLLLVLVSTMTSLPALLVLLPARLAGISLVGARFSFAPVAAFTWKHRRSCTGIAVGLGVLAAAAAFRPGPFSWLEDDLRVMHPVPNAALDAQQKIGEIFGISPGTLLILLSVDDPADLVPRAHQIARALESAEARHVGVAGAIGLHSLVPDPSRVRQLHARLGADEPDRAEAEFRAALAASSFDPAPFDDYARFLHRLLAPSPSPTVATLAAYPDLADTVLARRPAGSEAAPAPTESLTTVLLSRDLDRRESRAAAVETIRSLLSGIPGATVTGLPVLGYDAEDVIRRDLPRVLAVGLAIVVLFLGVYFRNVGDVALALVPFAFGVLAMAAWMRLTRTPFNMVNQMAIPILCGIGVDFGIFLVGLARHARARGADTTETVRRFGASFHAIFMSTAPNILAIGSLSATSVPAIQSLGNALAVGLVGAWFSAQFIVAPLAIRRRHAAPTFDRTTDPSTW